MRYPMRDGVPAPIQEIEVNPEFIEADCITLDDKYRIDKVLRDDTWRTYHYRLVKPGDDEPIEGWDRTQRTPFKNKRDAMDEILKLWRQNGGR